MNGDLLNECLFSIKGILSPNRKIHQPTYEFGGLSFGRQGIERGRGRRQR